MSRRIASFLALIAARAYAQPIDAGEANLLSNQIGDQGIGVQVGMTTGGRVTPGGLRVVGHYLYQLADRDWFDGGAVFTFGGSSAQCFRDRMNQFLCEHGIADGQGFEVALTVRHYFEPQGEFLPFARYGLGFALVRFPADGVSGFAVPLHGGGGVRVAVAESVAVIGEGELQLGLGTFNHSLGAEPQFGFAVTAGAEFRLQ